MIYTNLDGVQVSGEVISEGPLHNTCWVRGGGGSFAVVKVAKVKGVEQRTQVDYTIPQHLPPVDPAVLAVAQEVVDRYKAFMDELRPILGPTTPIHPDYEVASAILKAHDAAQKSRKPFLDVYPHPGDTKRLPISLKRLRELADE